MIREGIISTLAVLALSGSAVAGELKPMHSLSIDLGTMNGVAYYTVESAGYHVVATLAGDDPTVPVRFEAVLASGQSVTLSSPRSAGLPPVSVEISRVADQVQIVESDAATN
jgi:hypothetical protein